MNCTDVRAVLPALLYGDVDTAARADLDKHLAGCADCRREWAALREVRRLLDATPVPEMHVDLPRLYQQTAERQERRVRRWRRAAVSLLGVAAVLAFVAVALHLEIRVEAHQVTLRWGAPPPVPEAPPQPPVPVVQTVRLTPEELQRLTAAEEHLRLVSTLIHAVAADVEARDQEQRGQLDQLRALLREARQESSERWTAVLKYAEALYSAQLVLSKKGATP